MARYASQERAGFYPTPPSIVTWLISVLKGDVTGRVFDPFAGDGLPLTRIAKALNFYAYGCEIHQGRAHEVEHKITNLHEQESFNPAFSDTTFRKFQYGDFNNLQFSQKSFNLLFLNPPYDYDKEDKRLEYRYLKNSNYALQHNGTLVYIIPQQSLAYTPQAEYLAEWFTDLKVYRFHDDEFNRFKQVVVIGKKRHKRTVGERKFHSFMVEQITRIGKFELLPQPIDKVKGLSIQINPLANTNDIKFRSIFPNTYDAIEELESFGAYAKSDLSYYLVPPSTTNVKLNPLMPFSSSHISQVLVAGALNNMVIGEGNKRLLIKGSASKSVGHKHSKLNFEDGSEERKTINKEYVESEICTIDTDGNVTTLTGKNLNKFFQQRTQELAKLIAEIHPPQYKLELGKYEALIGDLGSPLTIQKHAAAAVATCYKSQKVCFIDGEQSVGKTRTAFFAMKAAKLKSAIAICQPHLWKKWIREGKIVFPNAYIKFADTPKKIDKWFKHKRKHPNQVHIMVMKFTDIRQGSGWIPATMQFPVASPEEVDIFNQYERGKVILPPKLTKKYKHWVRWNINNDFVKDPNTGKRVKWYGEDLKRLSVEEAKKQFHSVYTPHQYPQNSFSRVYYNSEITHHDRWNNPTYDINCNGTRLKERKRYIALYQRCRHNKKTGSWMEYEKRLKNWEEQLEVNPRATMPVYKMRSKASAILADYISRKYKRQFDLLIADECHKLRGARTGQGIAFARLASASKHILGLSGSMSNGKASGIFPILYRTNSEVRRLYTDYSKKGVYRILGRQWMRDFGIMQTTTIEKRDSTGKLTNTNTSPGIESSGYVPAILKYTLPCTVYMNLDHLGVDLPPYKEHLVMVMMNELMRKRHNVIRLTLGAEARLRLARQDKSLLGAYRQVNLCAPDSPWREEIVIEPSTRKHPKPKVLFRIPGIPNGEALIYPKERAILDKMLEVNGEGRRTLLICTQTGTRDITDRWQTLIKDIGLSVARLSGKVDTSEREQWIEEQYNKGIQVIIANPRAVETGLDIIGYPVIMVMGIEEDPTVLQQVTRRALRIGQTQNCDVYFFVYAMTFQENAIANIKQKMLAMKKLRGAIVDESSIANAEADSLDDLLAKILLNDDLSEDEDAEEIMKEINNVHDELKKYQYEYDLVADPNGYFNGCETEYDFKSRYRSLVKQYHPDAQHSKPKVDLDKPDGFVSLQDMFNKINEQEETATQQAFVGFDLKELSTPMNQPYSSQDFSVPQWVSGQPAHKLVRKSDKLPPFYATEQIEADDKIVKVKLFTPTSDWTWYLVEYDPATHMAFGYVKRAYDPFSEWGYIPLDDIVEIGTGKQTGIGMQKDGTVKMPTIPVERDIHFEPCEFRELRAQWAREEFGENMPPIEDEDDSHVLHANSLPVVEPGGGFGSFSDRERDGFDTIMIHESDFHQLFTSQMKAIENFDHVKIVNSGYGGLLVCTTYDDKLLPHVNLPGTKGRLGMRVVPLDQFDGEVNYYPHKGLTNLAVIHNDEQYVMTEPVFVIPGHPPEHVDATDLTQPAPKEDVPEKRERPLIELPGTDWLKFNETFCLDSILADSKIHEPIAIGNKYYVSIDKIGIRHDSGYWAYLAMECVHPLLFQGESHKNHSDSGLEGLIVTVENGRALNNAQLILTSSVYLYSLIDGRNKELHAPGQSTNGSRDKTSNGIVGKQSPLFETTHTWEGQAHKPTIVDVANASPNVIIVDMTQQEPVPAVKVNGSPPTLPNVEDIVLPEPVPAVEPVAAPEPAPAPSRKRKKRKKATF